MDFIDFLLILGTHSESFLGSFGPKEEVFFISISRLFFLLVFGSKFGCLGSEKQAFGMEGIAKIDFRRNWISYDFRVDFS